MARPLITLAATLIIMGAGSVFAASSTDLAVTGLITPSACVPTLSQGGVADYGKIAARDLQISQPTPLPATTLQLNVNCSAATLFALNGVDNRPGSSIDVDSSSYGLGFINGTEKVGSFLVVLNNYLADSQPVTKLVSRNNGASWIENSEDAIWIPGWFTAFGSNSGGDWAPVAITTLTSDVRINPIIAASETLTLTEEQPIDGSATLEVRYL
ncbi:DUF1120 domain-containing protein [Pseudomonas poae]|uniref:DUF1120 domain-containing protein n=1 Tax=Pseudomonas poae TaxID=200451 RepID=A0A7M1KB76_9PSED|nr:DUF1120 domain-containing protein [Pseudomonas poae]QOQ73513.1 DUF1120 domain-containing protein [Pseudomonas poae]